MRSQGTIVGNFAKPIKDSAIMQSSDEEKAHSAIGIGFIELKE